MKLWMKENLTLTLDRVREKKRKVTREEIKSGGKAIQTLTLIQEGEEREKGSLPRVCVALQSRRRVGER